ncbi:isoprenylcysteine carboxylmethyltransferase family protein [Nocardia sp. 2]|uniref:Isoprenylcysteine carboxylmethyltransferase family protein n=1 Tax=Nocardia acididurans TaxID=2802282 RepID=A0ABS1M8V1_9NOCA|nr:isoprenylcysteine carboxylmethyltransferase family protein [Nocardia acididurans]MBL1077072.1 isoprenylcysteine carboxylmethyltransferase family protein [Nocardia acididurans]
MRTLSATVVSALWFVLAPGMVAGVVPWWLTGWHSGPTGRWWLPVSSLGVAMIAAGVAVLLYAFARFVREGRGTPLPAAPTERLVIGGVYRYVRNPMYVAVVAVILGQALVLARFGLVWYAAAVCAIVAGFVYLYEEPTLRDQFGDAYDEYRRAVPAWVPRLTPWRG